MAEVLVVGTGNREEAISQAMAMSGEVMDQLEDSFVQSGRALQISEFWQEVGATMHAIVLEDGQPRILCTYNCTQCLGRAAVILGDEVVEMTPQCNAHGQTR